MSRDHLSYPLVVAVLAVVASALLLGAPTLLGTTGQLLLGAPLVLVFPGYVVFALLFRRTRESGDEPRVGERNPLVTFAVAVGFSVVVVPILVRVVMLTVGYSRQSVVLAVAAFVVTLGTAGAVYAPGSVSPRNRSLGELSGRGRGLVGSYVDRDSSVATARGVLLVLSVLFFLGTVGFALSGEPQGESYTELYLLTENESGELVASGYPTTLAETGTTQLVAGIENHERAAVTYTLVVEVQGLDDQSVVARREALRTTRSVEAGETARVAHQVEPELTARDLRIQYYLYRGDAPADPGAESAYRRVNLSVEAAG